MDISHSNISPKLSNAGNHIIDRIPTYVPFCIYMLLVQTSNTQTHNKAIRPTTVKQRKLSCKSSWPENLKDNKPLVIFLFRHRR